MEEYSCDKFTGSLEDPLIFWEMTRRLWPRCVKFPLLSQVTCHGLFTRSLRVYLPFRQHHKPSKKSTQSRMCWVSRLSKNDTRLFFFSFFFLINLFRHYVLSVNNSGRTLVGSQSSSQGRCPARKQDSTQQLCQERKLARYWIPSACSSKAGY